MRNWMNTLIGGVLPLVLCPMGVLAQNPLDSALAHRVISGWSEPDGTRMAALELTLAPGWKTYWRAPGDAGIPPEFSWRGSRNLADLQVYWPTPKVFWQSGMRSVGYSERVVLPLSVSAKRPGKDIHLKGHMVLGVCSDICIPASLDIEAVLPASESNRAPEIAAALAALPFSAQEAGVRNISCALAPTQDGLEVTARVTMPHTGGREEAIIEAPLPQIWVSEPKTSRDGDTLTIRAEMMAQHEAPFVIDRSGVRITVIGQNMAVDIQGCS